MDLEKFFDRVNHDMLIARVARKVKDKRVLGLIRRYLQAGMMQDGIVMARDAGTPLLSNIVLVDRTPKLKPAPASVKRLKQKLKDIFRRGRGCCLPKIIEQLRPVLRGWATYFSLSGVTGVFRELDEWLRRRMRCLVRRRWKRPRTRAKRLMQFGLEEVRAWKSAYNGRGPWWNAGAGHMNQAFPKTFFDRAGLTSVYDQVQKMKRRP